MFSRYAFSLSLAAVLVAAAGAARSGAQQPAAAPPPGPGLTVVNEKCGFCHTVQQVFSARKPAAEWPGVVQQMIDRGAELTPEEQATVSGYLATHFASDGPGAKAADTAAPSAGTTPAPAAPAKH